jgi:beta-phosphoglucomutase-like phosphatase (HAD superfamily)
MSLYLDNYDLFLFDLDDTLVKTEKIHYEAWLMTLKQFIDKDFSISEDEFYKIFHSDIPNNIPIYLSNVLKLNDINTIINSKNTLYFQLIERYKNNIIMVEGCEKFIEKILEKNKKFIIVSNSLKYHIEFFQRLFPILENSSAIYYREMFKNKKPDPECYRKVVEDFPNMKMVCFEDSLTGIKAATQISELDVVYINSPNYPHHTNILSNYNITHIFNYNDII